MTNQSEKPKDQAKPLHMLHRVVNHCEHSFEQGRSTVRIEAGHESAAVTAWITIPPAAGLVPGEAVLDDEQLEFLKASPVCKHWLKNDPVTNRQQVVVVESFPAPASAS